MPDTAVEHSLLDAAIAARRLLIQYQRLITTAPSPPVKLTALKPGGWAQDEVRKGLIDAACLVTGKQIDVEEVSPGGKVVQAYVKNYPETAQIFVVESRTRCWRRFLVAKELCHLLLSEAANSTSSYEEVEDLIDRLINGKFDSDPNPALLVENAAYIGAIELLLPQSFEEIAEREFRRGAEAIDVATKFLVPERIVEFRYQGQGKEIFNSIYAEHTFKHLEFAAITGS